MSAAQSVDDLAQVKQIPEAAQIVVAIADAVGGAAVLTTDPRDLRALARHAAHDVRISSV